ncbi:hypothetical protein K525DRAFT_236804 [Schizophyllum commune Loenen D]|nr:hypothetical protein K525DRAFT_236804 [Schizophyllum commune Loenen D]
MMEELAPGLTLPPFGDPTFAPALFSLVRDAAPLNAPVDPVIIQAILLCLICGNKHLILRTAPEDVAIAAKAAVATLSAIFGLTTHRLKLASHRHGPTYPGPDDTATFLRSLFLPSTTRTSTHYDTVYTKRAHARKKRRSSGSSSQRPSLHHWRASPRPPTPQSPLKNSVALPPRIPSNDADSQSAEDPFATFGRSKGAAKDSRPLIIRPVPHVHSDPLPQPSATLEVPEGLVITGLEAADSALQRALQRVMTERRVVLEEPPEVWGKRSSTPTGTMFHGSQSIYDCPDEFIVVYVCALEPYERPALLRSLLDKFSMSVNLTLHFNTRQLLKSTPSQSTPAYGTSPTSTPRSMSNNAQNWSNYPPALPPTLLASMRRACKRATISPQLELYLLDLFAATRHRPELDAMLLTATCQAEAALFARAARVVGRDLTGMELLQTALDVGDEGASGSLTIDYRGEAALVDPFRDIQDDEDRALDVSDADVARIFPRVVSHRLSTRAGPDDEVLGSVAYGAAGVAPVADGVWKEGRSVKDVLIKILGDV